MRTVSAAFFLSISIHAQITPPLSSLSGAVTDFTGTPLPTVFVELTFGTPAQKSRKATDSKGMYAFEGLHEGEYSLTIVAPGFSTLRVKSEFWPVNLSRLLSPMFMLPGLLILVAEMINLPTFVGKPQLIVPELKKLAAILPPPLFGKVSRSNPVSPVIVPAFVKFSVFFV